MFNCMIVIASVILGHQTVLGSWNLGRSYSYSDTCSYHLTNYPYGNEFRSNSKFLCGDKCLFRDPIDEHESIKELCTCGENTIDDDSFCCAPSSVRCNKTQKGAECPEGVVQNVNSKHRCNTKCYNDYFTSKYIGQNAHFSCPETCVDWKDWCHGVSFCDQDEQICGEDLRCPEGWGNKKYIMNTSPVRAYCHKDPGKLNDNAYDTIDRSDEEDVFKVDAARKRLDYTTLTTCERVGRQGFHCSGACVLSHQWCSDQSPSYCSEYGINTNDPALCSNHTFWRNIPCVQTIDRTLVENFRCKGAIQHCYWPLSNNPALESTCRDLSDRVFDSTKPCPDFPDHICIDSCKDQGPGCRACTNPAYVSCNKSNTCIHPSLRCDGHPQCEHGEDEVLENCKNEYKLRQLLPETATFRCISKMYPIIETYATACDGITECLDEDDEKFCSGYSILKQILVTTSILIALLYLGQKFRRIAKHTNYDFQLERQELELHSDILKTYSENHDNNEVLEKVNIFLLNIMFTRRTDITKAFYKKLYAIEEAVHNSNKAEIYCCLHTNFDPLIMERVDASQFEGLEQKFIDFSETLFQDRFITRIKNFIISHERLSTILNTLTRLVKLEIKYLDLLKDFSLSFSLFFVVGGIQALQDFGINFSMGIVLCLLTTVLLPIFFATLHLVTNNPFMIFGLGNDQIKSPWKKIGMIAFCCLFSIFNPILLINAYERAKEKSRLMAKSMDKRVCVLNWVFRLHVLCNILSYF